MQAGNTSIKQLDYMQISSKHELTFGSLEQPQLQEETIGRSRVE